MIPKIGVATNEISETVTSSQKVQNVEQPIPMVDSEQVQNPESSTISTRKSEIANKFKEAGYDEYYEMNFSDDGNFLLITIKETGAFFPDPNAQNIVDDFIGKPGILYNNNKELLQKRYNYTGESGSSYNHAKLRAGDTIKIPIDDVKLNDSPSGFFSRLFSTS